MEIYNSPSSWAGMTFRTTLVPRSYVMIERIMGDDVTSVRRFSLGDEVEVDSYNLIYTGVIVGITDKNVLVVDTMGRKRRMRPMAFTLRNWDFDAAAARRHNGEAMMHI